MVFPSRWPYLTPSTTSVQRSRNPHASSAKALYFDDHRDAIATCTFSTVPSVAGTLRMALGEYTIFLPKPEVLTVTCAT